MISVALAAGTFAVARFLVPVALGTKWLEAVPLMEILAVNGALLLFHSSICAVLIANGYPARVTMSNGLYVVMSLVLLVALVPGLGVTGALVPSFTAARSLVSEKSCAR